MVAQPATEARDREVQAVTAGALLRDARKAAGVHIAALAVALKVPVTKLEALESDNFSALPDIVFVRALASSVCRTLKMDPHPVLALLPQGEGPRLSAGDAGLNAPVKEFTGRSFSAAFAVPGPRPLAWVVGLLLLGAALMVFLPRSLESDLSAFFKQPEAGPEMPAPIVADPESAAMSPASAAPAAAPGVAVAVGEAREPAPLAPPAGALPSVAESATSPGAAETPAGVLAFKARSESWIQVREATGAVVLQRNLAPDEQVAVSGALPLAVVIGRADATEVFVRGKPYELGSVSRENVARFEVK